MMLSYSDAAIRNQPCEMATDWDTFLGSVAAKELSEQEKYGEYRTRYRQRD